MTPARKPPPSTLYARWFGDIETIYVTDDVGWIIKPYETYRLVKRRPKKKPAKAKKAGDETHE